MRLYRGAGSWEELTEHHLRIACRKLQTTHRANDSAVSTIASEWIGHRNVFPANTKVPFQEW
jgi:hypothetical protein